MGIGDHLRYAHASAVSPASAISVVRRSRVGGAVGTGRGSELASGSAAAHQPLAGHVEPRDMTVLPLPLELDRRGHRAHAAAADFGLLVLEAVRQRDAGVEGLARYGVADGRDPGIDDAVDEEPPRACAQVRLDGDGPEKRGVHLGVGGREDVEDGRARLGILARHDLEDRVALGLVGTRIYDRLRLSVALVDGLWPGEEPAERQAVQRDLAVMPLGDVKADGRVAKAMG